MRKILSIVLALVVILTMASCKLKKDGIFGTWESEYVYNGKQIVTSVTLNENYEYTYKSYSDGALSRMQSGTFEIHGEDLKLHIEETRSYTKLKVRDNKVYHTDWREFHKK